MRSFAKKICEDFWFRMTHAKKAYSPRVSSSFCHFPIFQVLFQTTMRSFTYLFAALLALVVNAE